MKTCDSGLLHLKKVKFGKDSENSSNPAEVWSAFHDFSGKKTTLNRYDGG